MSRNVHVACAECDRDFWTTVAPGENVAAPMCDDCIRLTRLDRVDRAAQVIVNELRDMQMWSASDAERILIHSRCGEIASELLRTYRTVNH